MGVTANEGDFFGNFEVEPHNLQKKENAASKARPFQKFPMHVYKPGGLDKLVQDEEALKAAVKQGWYDDVRKVPVTDEDDSDLPALVSQMTTDQAERVIAKASADELAAIEKDEQTHANREAVISLIDVAKDRLDGSKAPKAKAKAKK